MNNVQRKGRGISPGLSSDFLDEVVMSEEVKRKKKR